MSKPEVVVITGASAGVGRATGRAFAQRGAHIGLMARGRDGLEAARRETEIAGGRALALPGDVAVAEQVEAAAEAVETQFGPIDIWINNAMVSVFSPIKEMTADEFKRVTEVTYLGCVYGTLAALKRMLPRDRGAIVQVGSALAYRGIPLQAAYCGAKHAIRGFTESLRCELLHDNSRVRVVEVHMPALNTPQFSWVKTRLPGKPQPVPPIFQPEVAADAIVWAAHQRRQEVHVGWPTVKAIVGNKIAPRYVDRVLARHGYELQQLDDPVEGNRRDNLWEPLPGDHGAHGEFDARSESSSLQFWLSKNRRLLVSACVLLAMLSFGRAGRARTSALRLVQMARAPRERIPLVEVTREAGPAEIKKGGTGVGIVLAVFRSLKGGMPCCAIQEIWKVVAWAPAMEKSGRSRIFISTITLGP